MGGRYLISGTMLGMIAGLAKSDDCSTIEKMVHETTDKCHVWDSDNILEEDIDELKALEKLDISDEVLKTCPKCGSDNTNVSYYPEGKKFFKTDISPLLYKEPIWKVSETKQFYTLNQEVLIVHCRNCQYEWWEETLDS